MKISYLLILVILGGITITTAIAETVSVGSYPYIIPSSGGINPGLSVDVSGNVGIGTSNPSSILDVAKISSDSIIRSETTTSGNSILDLLNNGNQEYQLVANRTSNHLEIRRPYTLSSPIISMDPNSGNVGIGTSTPVQKFDVSGNIRLTGNIVSPNDICIGTC